MKNNIDGTLLNNFSKLTYNERIEKIKLACLLYPEEIAILTSKENSPHSLAEKLIENTISYFHLPLGVAVNFRINKHDYIIPMAVEETSVIAAASKAAKWIKNDGYISTKNLGTLAIGQIQLAKIKNFNRFKKTIEENKNNLIRTANENIAKNLVARGGGVKDMIIRGIPRGDGFVMGIIHVLVDTCDAMGANMINNICEFLKNPIEVLTKQHVNICILTNSIDTKLTQAKIVIRNVNKKLGEAIEEASLFAQLDPYRAITNNKGILNGIDAVAIATGNDWRAVEAGVHAYAAHSSQYSPVSIWKLENRDLIGILKAPINIGTVGGVTQLHPMARLCLKILGITGAGQLAQVMAAVGLVQNLAALTALTTEGIIKGHMRLHISNLCLSAGATEQEIIALKNNLEKHLVTHKQISVSEVRTILNQFRSENKEISK